MNFSKLNYQTHLFFILILFIQYLISLVFVGQIIIEPFDNLDIVVVGDHIISKIYKGDLNSSNYFLAGEIKWYYLEKLFYPINILHYFTNDKLFYFFNEILKKLFAYFSFYILAKSLLVSRFNSAFGGILYATFLYAGSKPLGLGLVFLPYILYLLLNKNLLNKKHFLILFLVGLNTTLIHNIFAFVLLIPLTLILRKEEINKKIYFQIFFTILTATILSNIHLIIGSAISEPIHRESFISRTDIVSSFREVFEYFLIDFNSANPLFIFDMPIIVLSIILLFLSILSKERDIKLIFIFIISVLILQSILGSTILNYVLVGIFDVFKSINFTRVYQILPVAYTLLFILLISHFKNKNLKYLLYFVSFIAIISLQLKTPLPVITQYFLKKNMYNDKFEIAKQNILSKNYKNFFLGILNKENFTNNKINFSETTNKTFDNYYDFKNYTFIRNIVKNSRVISVGLDPMVAVMNDIKVIDGYHTIYPLNYKIKFRKIIQVELDKNIKLKNYYDNWGNRIYAYYTNQNNIELNFFEAKHLGASYVISKFPIKDVDLKIVCYECNNSKNIFLYKIL